ncbi:D-alanyl-D-alanine carboxypeptidase family protein [Brevibacterium litoralis]|uniref:D-alanyl-D-alanine carboxypeptidase family protein n=1 Tax=Brevibacterium litoralis TaxID=3138935 RepID=UPI0032F05764
MLTRSSNPTSVLAGLLTTLLLWVAVAVWPTAGAHASVLPSEAPYYQSPDLGDGRPAPEPVALSWIVADMDTGQRFAGHDVQLEHAPASTIKLLSGLVFSENLDPQSRYEVTYDDMLVDGTKVGIMQGNRYKIDTLMHAMLMASANDAAHALAEAVGGRQEAARLMNEKAAELGLTGTVAKNTSGLDAEGQVTTVQDMLVIARAVMEDDYLMEVISTQFMQFPGHDLPSGEHVKGYQIQNHTQIVGSVDGGLGMKNGYTQAAGGSFVAVVERDGKTYGSAVLGASNNTRQSAVDLVEWAFAQTTLPDEDAVPLTRQDLDSAREAHTGRAEDRAAGAGDSAADGADADGTGAGGGEGASAAGETADSGTDRASGSEAADGPLDLTSKAAWTLLGVGIVLLAGVVFVLVMTIRTRHR